MRRLLAVARKELLQLRRDRMTLGMMVGIPVMQLLLFGYAINTDVRHIPTVIYDQDNSPESRDLWRSLEVTGFYKFAGGVHDYDEISRALRSGRARVALVVPPRFGEALRAGRSAQVQLVVDGSDPDPLGQINAVHVVLQDIDASSVPEVVVVNKVDAMDEEAILTLRQALPGAVWVSARTGAGMDELRELIAARLPHPEVDVEVLVPYDRGDLLSRVHESGEVISVEHTGDGTLLNARVSEALAGELAEYAHSG